MKRIHSFEAGTLFNNRYKLIQQVGVGGFAEVWRAFDNFTQTELAIKIYANLDQEGLSQLSAEYAKVSQLSHPNLLRAEHFDVWCNTPYLTMKYCAGGSLNNKLGQLSEAELLEVAKQMGRALSYLHANKVVHQDVKPANILIDISGEKPVYVLCDFGISTRTKTSMARSVNDGKKALYMTTFYAPPEKFSALRGDRLPDVKGDIFSLGVSLFELAGGTLPDGDNSIGSILQYNPSTMIDFSCIRDENLQRMLQTMMARERSARPDANTLTIWADEALQRRPVSGVAAGGVYPPAISASVYNVPVAGNVGNDGGTRPPTRVSGGGYRVMQRGPVQIKAGRKSGVGRSLLMALGIIVGLLLVFLSFVIFTGSTDDSKEGEYTEQTDSVGPSPDTYDVSASINEMQKYVDDLALIDARLASDSLSGDAFQKDYNRLYDISNGVVNSGKVLLRQNLSEEDANKVRNLMDVARAYQYKY